MFLFYFDGIKVTDPENWNTFTETIEYDDVIKGLLPSYKSKLNFTNDGYTYLYNRYKSDGYCYRVALRVDYKASGNTETLLKGYIIISDIVFDLETNTASCDITDNNYGAIIYNNKNIKTSLDTDKSKNGITITPCTSVDVLLFNPADSIFSGSKRKVYPLFDAFRFIIDFMTDGIIDFKSDFLSSGAGQFFDLKYLGIITGEGLRLSGKISSPFTSFRILFDEVNKKYPISFITGTENGRGFLRIENDAYFRNMASEIIIENIKNIKQSFDNEKLYSSIKLGGKSAEYDAAKHHLPYTQFITFKEEEYFFTGYCNIDKTLDLTSDYISDSNVIEEIVWSNPTNGSYDKDVFFIQYDYFGSAKATPNPSTNNAPYYYNGNLTNKAVADRYALNGNIAIYLSGSVYGFTALKNDTQDYGWIIWSVGSTPALSSQHKITYANLVTTSPQYSAALSRYTIPVAGTYTFEGTAWVYCDPAKTINTKYKIINVIRRFNSSGVIVSEISNTSDDFFGNATRQFTSVRGSAVYDVGDYVEIFSMYEYTAFNVGVLVGGEIRVLADEGTFHLLSAPTSGGVVVKNDKPYRISKFQFQKAMNNYKYLKLKENLQNAIIFSDSQHVLKGWVRKIERNCETSETKYELIGE